MLLIKYIGHGTESEQTLGIQISIFLAQFFNTSILIILMNANTVDSILFWLPFRGQYTDLTFEWYNDVASSLVTTMLTAAIMPVIQFFISFGMRRAFICLDRGFSCRKDRTKTKTIQQYVNLYSGPEYMMHAKYAVMLNVIFVTFMYGVAVPLLFPLAFLFFLVSFIVERLALAYSYRKPPMYDDVLNKSALSILKVAPVFMMLFGYWAMGNKQIFRNFVEGREYKTDPVITDHTGVEFKPDQSLPLFIFGALGLVFIFATELLASILRRVGILRKVAEDEVDEKLGSYIECLGPTNRKAWYVEESSMRKRLGLHSMNDEFLSKLKE